MAKDSIPLLGAILIGNPVSERHCVPFYEPKRMMAFWQKALGELSDILINRKRSYSQCLTTHFTANLLQSSHVHTDSSQ